jgi:hypothetical protein
MFPSRRNSCPSRKQSPMPGNNVCPSWKRVFLFGNDCAGGRNQCVCPGESSVHRSGRPPCASPYIYVLVPLAMETEPVRNVISIDALATDTCLRRVHRRAARLWLASWLLTAAFALVVAAGTGGVGDGDSGRGGHTNSAVKPARPGHLSAVFLLISIRGTLPAQR